MEGGYQGLCNSSPSCRCQVILNIVEFDFILRDWHDLLMNMFLGGSLKVPPLMIIITVNQSVQRIYHSCPVNSATKLPDQKTTFE
jgi:hypothetical protein